MSRHRRGFTLVELLVVAGIMAVLFALIVAGGRSKPTAVRAAQDFASMLLATQSRALGKPQGAAIVIEAAADAPGSGAVIHEADTLPPIVITEVTVGIDASFPDLVTIRNFQAGSSTLLQDCYKMRFRRNYGSLEAGARAFVSPWLGLQTVSLGSPPPGLPVRRSSAGQGGFNTFFSPRKTSATEDPPGSTLSGYEAIVVRHPTIGLSSTRLPPVLAIDLGSSGVGDNLAAAHGYGSFAGKSPLAIVFDQTGRVSDVIQSMGPRAVKSGLTPGSYSVEHPEWRDPAATDPLVPNEIIYFLFVDRTAITNGQSLASDSAAWVALDPLTGRISVSSNVAGSTDVVPARANARSAVLFGK